MGDSHSRVDSHTISDAVGAVARTLQIAAIVCAGFALGSLLDRNLTEKWTQLISRFKYPSAVDRGLKQS